MMLETDVLVIGGGAAGLLCAIEAGKRGRRVVVLEHAERIGKKIAISGGGRCNFTNINTSPDNFISANPHFCKSALARYRPSDFISLVEKHGIPYHEKKLGQLFCDEGSRRIIEMLLHECEAAGVEIRCGAAVLTIGKKDKFRSSNRQRQFCLAITRRCHRRTIDSHTWGYRLWLPHGSAFGLAIQEPRPALVPFTLSTQAQSRLTTLSGISVDALVSCNGQQFRENLLVTHRGLSGPVILQISSYWQPGAAIAINLLPEHDAGKLLSEHQNREVELANFLGQFLPRRFAHAWCALNTPSQPLKRFTPSAAREYCRAAQSLGDRSLGN